MLNGSRSPFFKIFKGQRHAEHHECIPPLSPLLFNLDADALSVMLEKAVHHGRIVGILPGPIQGGISHSQYADDDTLMMIDGNCSSQKSETSLLF